MEKSIVHNPDRNRFEVQVNGFTAYVRYHLQEGILNILSTQVPSELEGQGIASALTRHVLEYARAEGLKVIPTCSFTAVYLRRHPEYAELSV